MRTYKIAAIPGDGIGGEVVGAAVEVLKACATRDGKFALEISHFDWGSARYKRTGVLMPEGGRSDAQAVRCHSLRRGRRAGRA